MEQQRRTRYVLQKNEDGIIQVSSAQAAMDICSLIRTCLGPNAMQKIVITKMNSIEVTNDGNSIVRELNISHPVAKCLVELAQTQDDECGDGTTSVMILAAELLYRLAPLTKNYHPTEINKIVTYIKRMALNVLEEISEDFKEENLLGVVNGAIGTKLCTLLQIKMGQIAIDVVKNIQASDGSIDLRNNVRIEKVLGRIEETRCIKGIVLNKTLFHPGMPKRIVKPKVLLLDLSIEYKKNESATQIDLIGENDFTALLKGEEIVIREMVETIADTGVNLVVTEKGICDLALGLFAERKITAVRRVRKSNLIRLSKLCGCEILSRLEDLQKVNVGEAELFEYKAGNTENEYYCYFYQDLNPGVVTLWISGPNMNVNNELERNFFDAAKIARNILRKPKIVPGGSAPEIEISCQLEKKFEDKTTLSKKVAEHVCQALETFPSILIGNALGANYCTLNLIKELKQRHFDGKWFAGINGNSGKICDIRTCLMDPLVVKEQCIKSAFDFVTQILRVDGIIEIQPSADNLTTTTTQTE